MRPGIRLARKKKADDTGNPASPSGRPHGHPLGDIGPLDQNVEADLVDGLVAEGDCALSLVAELDGRIVGHIAFSPMQADFPALGLAPLSVDPAFQRKGIGTALVWESLDRLKGSPWRAIFVLGDTAYYRRFGFDPALAAGFDCPYAGEHLMALALGEGIPAARGKLDYARAFSRMG